MIRKALLLLAATASLAATAQAVGEWTIYPLFDGNATALADGKSKVYYVSAGRLFSYDKEGNETYIYTAQNKLSDINIDKAFYNPDDEYLFVAYDNGNVDLVYDNGRVVNMPDIKDASLSTSKTVNDVAFHKERIYCATAFGMVVFDEKKHQVAESGVYNRSIQNIAVANDHIVLFPDADTHRLYRSPVGDRHNSLDKFTDWGDCWGTLFGSVGNNLYYLNSGNVVIIKVDWSTYDKTVEVTSIKPVVNPVTLADGTLQVITADKIIILDEDGKTVSETALPEDFRNKTIAFESSPASAWVLDAEGLGNYNLTTSPVTVLQDKASVNGSNVREVAYMRLSPDCKRIYLSDIGDTNIKSIGGGDVYAKTPYTNYLENGEFHDVSIYDASGDNPLIPYLQNLNHNKRLYGGSGRIAVDPENPDRYYIAATIEGLYVVENGVEVAKFNYKNSLYPDFYTSAATENNRYFPMSWDVNFDPEGNLWCGASVGTNFPRYSSYMVLPTAKLKGDLSKVTRDDWQMSKHTTLESATGAGWKDQGSLICRRSRMMFTFNGSYEVPAVAYDTKGTYTNTADDVAYALSNMIDQDGNSYKPMYHYCAVEDERGRVWFGTSAGLYEITNPLQATDPNMRIRRLKVPRNDGTNYADYLLDSEQINDIAVDSSNRKWIATESSGVYLVSEDGDKIIEHFDKENSPLPSNSVYSILCDPNSNLVYFGMATGLVSYSSTSSPAAASYDDVYAYPNPVRPDYTGPVTVTGLMENSLVKIADAAGNVFAQGRSNGGMFVWDGCNSAGERVRSGVYFVFASQNADGSASGAVTKILVIN